MDWRTHHRQIGDSFPYWAELTARTRHWSPRGYGFGVAGSRKWIKARSGLPGHHSHPDLSTATSVLEYREGQGQDRASDGTGMGCGRGRWKRVLGEESRVRVRDSCRPTTVGQDLHLGVGGIVCCEKFSRLSAEAPCVLPPLTAPVTSASGCTTVKAGGVVPPKTSGSQ